MYMIILSLPRQHFNDIKSLCVEDSHPHHSLDDYLHETLCHHLLDQSLGLVSIGEEVVLKLENEEDNTVL